MHDIAPIAVHHRYRHVVLDTFVNRANHVSMIFISGCND